MSQYECVKCSFIAKNKQCYKQHLTSIKHIRLHQQIDKCNQTLEQEQVIDKQEHPIDKQEQPIDKPGSQHIYQFIKLIQDQEFEELNKRRAREADEENKKREIEKLKHDQDFEEWQKKEKRENSKHDENDENGEPQYVRNQKGIEINSRSMSESKRQYVRYTQIIEWTRKIAELYQQNFEHHQHYDEWLERWDEKKKQRYDHYKSLSPQQQREFLQNERCGEHRPESDEEREAIKRISNIFINEMYIFDEINYYKSLIKSLD